MGRFLLHGWIAKRTIVVFVLLSIILVCLLRGQGRGDEGITRLSCKFLDCKLLYTEQMLRLVLKTNTAGQFTNGLAILIQHDSDEYQ